MQKNIDILEEKEETLLDYYKIWRIIWDKKKYILITYAVIFIFTILLTLILPKKYETDAQILINKSQDTNLSELNPFAIAETGGGLDFSQNMFQNNTLGNELEIMKSPLVMDKVVKENNIKYTNGPKKGQYLDPSFFANSQSLNIETEGNTNIISISYKSPDPKMAYSVVKSILSNYKDTYEKINSQKATNDKIFLDKSYKDSRIKLEEIISNLKDFKTQKSTFKVVPEAAQMFGMMGIYDKKLNKNLNEITIGNIESLKLESEIEQEFEKVKMIKARLEWINLVEQLSKDISNITILKKPEIKEDFEYSEPNILINIIIALVLSFTCSVLLVSGLEMFDKKITFAALNEDTILVEDDKLDLIDLKARVLSKDTKQLAIINLTNDNYISETINKELNNINIESVISNQQSEINQQINNIKTSEYVILIGKTGSTSKESFNKIKAICKKMNKQIINTFLIV